MRLFAVVIINAELLLSNVLLTLTFFHFVREDFFLNKAIKESCIVSQTKIEDGEPMCRRLHNL